MNLKRSNLAQEMRLLLSCCRTSPPEDDFAKIKLLSNSLIDWDAFLGLVDRHRVYPLVYQNLSRAVPEDIPGYVVESLFNRVGKNTRRSLTLTSEFVRLFKLFVQSNIPLIPLKGPILALQVYEDVGLRHAGDLDLLVAPQHIEEA